jgi:hypothetical protein
MPIFLAFQLKAVMETSNSETHDTGYFDSVNGLEELRRQKADKGQQDDNAALSIVRVVKLMERNDGEIHMLDVLENPNNSTVQAEVSNMCDSKPRS